MKRILREPLLHFLLLGAGLFIAFSLVPKSGGGDELRKIVITQGQLDSLVEGFARTRQRPPTREEWEGLIRDKVRQEVYYREALALGLDKDDTIVRRRMAQKMQFLAEEVPFRPSRPRRIEAGIRRRTPTTFAWSQSHVSSGVSQPDSRGRKRRGRGAGTCSQAERVGCESCRGDGRPLMFRIITAMAAR